MFVLYTFQTPDEEWHQNNSRDSLQFRKASI